MPITRRGKASSLMRATKSSFSRARAPSSVALEVASVVKECDGTSSDHGSVAGNASSTAHDAINAKVPSRDPMITRTLSTTDAHGGASANTSPMVAVATGDPNKSHAAAGSSSASAGVVPSVATPTVSANALGASPTTVGSGSAPNTSSPVTKDSSQPIPVNLGCTVVAPPIADPTVNRGDSVRPWMTSTAPVVNANH